MTTFDELILAADVELEQNTKDRDRALATVKTIYDKARREGRSKLSDDEEADIQSNMERHGRFEDARKGTLNKLANLKTAKAAEDANERALNQRAEDPAAAPPRPKYDQVARIGREERTYHAGNDRRGSAFLTDVVRAFLHRDLASEQRLFAHMNEEKVERGQYLQRAVGTGAFAGLTVPQYLTAFYAPAVAARRPFADAMTRLDLPPSGMNVNISRITTSSSAALQASENSGVSETNMDDTLLTESVQTAAGQQTVSRQAIERGAGVEDVVMSDLQRRVATNLDSTIINQATTGLSAIAQANTYDDATPTAVELYPKLLGAMAASEGVLLDQATPDLAVMHSRRWHWLSKEMTSSWPLISQPNIPTQAGGVNFAERYGSGARGVLPNGTVVIVDNNIATNLGTATSQDEIYIVPSEESYLWEDPDAPQFIRAEQTNAASLGVLLVLYTYFAYTLRRYTNSHQKIGGTGLATPSF